MELIRVSAGSSVSAVAEAITSVVLEYRRAEVQAIGADAANQAIQALDLATCSLKNNGVSITAETRFSKITVNHRVRTAVKLVVMQSPGPGFAPMGVTTSPKSAELPRV